LISESQEPFIAAQASAQDQAPYHEEESLSCHFFFGFLRFGVVCRGGSRHSGNFCPNL